MDYVKLVSQGRLIGDTSVLAGLIIDDISEIIKRRNYVQVKAVIENE